MRSTYALAATLIVLAAPGAGAQSREGQRLPATVDRPDIIFWNHCSVCHGEKGDGQTFAKNALDPPPFDFTSAKARETLSRAHMIETVKKGARTKEGARTAMSAWTGRLSDKQIEAVVDYVIVKFMQGKPMPDSAAQVGHEHHGHDHSHVKAVDYPFGVKPNPGRGKTLYATVCTKCHGERGDGKTTTILQGPKPRDFTSPDFRQFANGFTMFSAISRGNTHMPAFGQVLSAQDIGDISEYVLRTFVKKTPPPAVPASHKHDAHKH